MEENTLYPDHRFVREVESNGPFQAEACYQCRKCTNGCPVTFAMDLYPDEVIRLTILGQRDRVLSCGTIWVCSACETCTTRCPNEIKISELMDCLKEMALNEGIAGPHPQVPASHKAFLNHLKKRGRIFEATYLPYTLIVSGELKRRWRNGTWRAEAKLGLQMALKGRVALYPKKIRGIEEVRRMITHTGWRS